MMGTVGDVPRDNIAASNSGISKLKRATPIQAAVWLRVLIWAKKNDETVHHWPCSGSRALPGEIAPRRAGLPAPAESRRTLTNSRLRSAQSHLPSGVPATARRVVAFWQHTSTLSAAAVSGHLFTRYFYRLSGFQTGQEWPWNGFHWVPEATSPQN